MPEALHTGCRSAYQGDSVRRTDRNRRHLANIEGKVEPEMLAMAMLLPQIVMGMPSWAVPPVTPGVPGLFVMYREWF